MDSRNDRIFRSVFKERWFLSRESVPPSLGILRVSILGNSEGGGEGKARELVGVEIVLYSGITGSES